uniref:(northern house mosquito) hypothetical protein n=1 Tax=Culex pipiens TaxID=7175 RepID=A0A8D8BL19_CULPI
MVWFQEICINFFCCCCWNFLYGFFSRDDFGPLGRRLSLNVLTLLIDGPKLVPGMISDQVFRVVPMKFLCSPLTCITSDAQVGFSASSENLVDTDIYDRPTNFFPRILWSA